uniref:Olfactory receptor n=1 Tax=Leptobrachium leishanense TaxID=445787 RepID=A0A8C5M544_9ANUR
MSISRALALEEAIQTMNLSTIKEILLLGFQTLHDFRILFCHIFLISYCLTISVNILIIVLVSSSRSLHSPMYFFLMHLSISDLILTTDIVPLMLEVIINNGAKMTLAGCITQFYFFGVSEASECLLLTVMSYDRYLAICNPLRYVSVMSPALCIRLVLMSWVISFSILFADVMTISSLNFCGPNVINHFFCDFFPLLGLSCSDFEGAALQGTLMAIPVVILLFIIIVVSYSCIVSSILKIPSLLGRQKAFSTCSSHLIVVSIYYGTMIGIYTQPPRSQSFSANKALSLVYTVVTPLFNPVIYSLRNKDIKVAFIKLFGIK